jgi:aminoglycoside 6'-N-acetyltransferase
VTWHFRRLTRGDLPMLAEWLGRPHVEQWWQEEHTLAAVEARYGPSLDGTDPTELFVVERDGEPMGFIQRYLLADNPSWVGSLAPTGAPANAAGIDYLVAAVDQLGHGLGPELIGRFVAATWVRYPDIEAIVVDVDQRNRRSWRALEKVGFGRIWSGHIEADDPSDSGPAHVYAVHRPPTPTG